MFQLEVESENIEHEPKDIILSNDNAVFSLEPNLYQKFSNVLSTPPVPERTGIQLKSSHRKMIQRKTAKAFRNLVSSKSLDQGDNSVQEFTSDNVESLSSRPTQKLSTGAGTSSSSESSPSSTSLRQRISTLHNFGTNALLKPKIFNMHTMLNRRWGGSKNGKDRTILLFV